MPQKRNPKAQATSPHSVRIIAGQWRSRKVAFADLPQCRPTPDRVRVTLFNWLAPIIEGTRCLDLFAGSGVLGLEALSRGAAEVSFIDSQSAVIDAIREQLKVFKDARGQVIRADALSYLTQGESQFDIVFVDPPYDSNLVQPICAALEQHQRLAPQARIYLETRIDQPLPELPANWQVLRSKQAGQVSYHLAVRH